MPGGGKPKRIEDTTAKDIWLSLFFGTLICGVILAASFFKMQPGRLAWTQRIFCALWLLFLAQTFRMAPPMDGISIEETTLIEPRLENYLWILRNAFRQKRR